MIIKKIEDIFLKKRREKELKEIGFRDKIKIRSYKDGYAITNSLRERTFCEERQELIEDIFSSSIYHIERLRKRFRNDNMFFYTKNFKRLNKYNFKNIEKDKRFFGVNYFEKEILIDLNEASSMIFLGVSGSGKTSSIKQQIKYHELMMKKYYPDKKIQKIIIDPKADDFKNDLSGGDYFFRLHEDDELSELIEILLEVDKDNKEANEKGEQTQVKWVLVMDEILDYLNKAKELTKEREALKLKLAKILEKFIVQYARQQKMLIVAGTQSFSVSDLAITVNRFTRKIISKAPNKAISNVFGTKRINNPDLARGRWIVIEDDMKVQFPESLSSDYYRQVTCGRSLIFKALKVIKRFFNLWRKEIAVELQLQSKKKKLIKYRKFINRNRKRYQGYFVSSGESFLITGKTRNAEENKKFIEHNFLTKRILRDAFLRKAKGVGLQ